MLAIWLYSSRSSFEGDGEVFFWILMLGLFESAAVFGASLIGLGFETGDARVACGFRVDFVLGLGEGSTVLLKKSVPLELFWVFPTPVGAVSVPCLVMTSLSEGLLAEAISKPKKARADTVRIKRNFCMARGLLLWCGNRFCKSSENGIHAALFEFGIELGAVIPDHAYALDDYIRNAPAIHFFEAIDDVVFRTFVCS